MYALTGNIANFVQLRKKLDCFERYINTGDLDENKPTSRFWKPKQQQYTVRGSSYYNYKCLQQFM